MLKLFSFFTEMGNWEVEEDDTLAVQDDDEVGTVLQKIKNNIENEEEFLNQCSQTNAI